MFFNSDTSKLKKERKEYEQRQAERQARIDERMKILGKLRVLRVPDDPALVAFIKFAIGEFKEGSDIACFYKGILAHCGKHNGGCDNHCNNGGDT